MSTEAEPRVIALVAARNEADRIAATVRTLMEALPGCTVVVADDASDDETAAVAAGTGATVVSTRHPHGKGGNMTNAAATLPDFAEGPRAPMFLLCDGDLGDTAGRLSPLVAAVASGECDVAIAAFRRRVGGGFGVALRYARWAIRRRCGYEAGAPISGQRALSTEAFRACYPFADGYGMEIGITIDAVRAGLRVEEIELDLEHRATGKTWRGFVHRGRQLRDFTRVYRAKG